MRRRSIGKPALLAGCALGAWLAIAPSAAMAQAFQGNGTVVTGDASITTGAGSTSVLLGTSETVINWTPFDTTGTGTIDFLPAGNTALFRSGFSNFTVLNRILPQDVNGAPTARAISLNGNVGSLISDPVTFNRGNVWFYSPTGIIVGPTAFFSVGSLVLTTNDIGFTENCGPCETYGSIYGPGGLVQFRGPEKSLTTVDIREGARIGALGPDGYVAIVAPRIVQAGTVVADGSIAYLAAEQADVTINAGLFNFTLLVGTTDPNGIVHSGTSTGTASTGYFTDPKAITVAAVSKNDALTMLLSGSLGYLPASNVFDDGSSVFLTAGNSASPADNIRIGDTSFGNRLDAYAAGDITVAPTAGSAVTGDPGGETAFESYANLFANRSLTLRADHGSTISALNSLNVGAYDALGNGGTLTIEALGASGLSAPGAIAITGGLFATASGFGASPPEAQIGGDGVGGSIALKANGGTIAADYMALEANGNGGFAELLGGDGTGGTILISAGYGGSITSPSTIISARGNGGGVFGSEGFGGVGNGGAIELTDSGTDQGADTVGGQLALGLLTLNASADGGYSGDFGSGHGGDAFGGTVEVTLSLQDQSFASFYATVNAHDGDTAIDPLAGTIDMVIGGGVTVDVADDLLLTANSLSGVNGGPTATGTGGTVNLTIQSDSTLNVAGSFYGEARADIAEPFGNIVIDSTPTLTGGTVNVMADGGAFNVRNLLVDVSAANIGAASFAGPATGGTATVSALSGGSITVDNGFGTALLTISADGYGAPGPSPAHAAGGTARLIAEDGSVRVLGDAEVSASGLTGQYRSPPPDGPGHNATGGTASVELRPGSLGTASLAADDLTINAIGDSRLSITMFSGEGTPPTVTYVPIQGDGGDGTGGMAGLTVAGGTLALDRVTLDSSGIGAGSAVSGNATALRSGDGFGGTSQVTISGGSADMTTLDLLSNGHSGDGTGGPAAEGSELAALAGNGTGGNARLLLDGSGMLRVIDTTIEANGAGARGMDQIDDGDASDGGIGTGGNAALTTASDWTGFYSTQTLDMRANGIGGVGGFSDPGSTVPSLGSSGDGGDGLGGIATIDLADGAFSLGLVDIEATGTGGYSGDASSGIPGAEGGYGTGGFARFALIDSPAGPLGLRDISNLQIDASGLGGFGSIFVAQSATGEVDLTVSVLNPASALNLPGSLSVYAGGVDQAATGGIEALISGAPLQVGSDVILSSDGPVTVTATQPLQAGTFVTLSGFSVTTTGLIQSGDQMSVEGIFGINADRLTSGDTTFLDSTRGPGPIVVADLLSAGLVTATGESIEIRSTGGLDFAEANASGGDLYIGTAGDLEVTILSAAGSATLETSAGNITTGDFSAGSFIYVDAFGSANLGNIGAGTDAAVTTRGGTLTVGNVTAGDDIWLSIFGTDATRVLTAGNLVTTGLGADDAAGPPELFGAYPNSAGPAGNVARLRSSGSLVIGDMQSPGRAILVADAGTTTAGDLSADEALIVLGRGDIALDAIATEGRFYVADSAMFLPNLPDAYDPASLNGLTPVRSSGGLTIGSAVEAGDVTVAVAGSATAPSWTSAGGLLIDAGGLFTSNVTVSAGGSASITADNGIDLTGLTSGGTTLLRSSTGTIAIDNLLTAGAVTARGTGIDITSSASLAFDDVAALLGDARIVTAGALTVGGITANDAIELESGGTFTLFGEARALTIDVISSDIRIDGEAQLGFRNVTDSITLINGDPDDGTFIGGGVGDEGGWILDGAEARRLFADESIFIGVDLDFEGPAANVEIGDLAMTFGSGGHIGSGGRLEISSPDRVDITGDVALTTSGPDDTFRIDPRLIALDTDTGSISMTLFAGEGGGGGTPQGRLELVADRIVAATGANITQLETLTDLDAITALLGRPGGTGEPLSAGTIHIDAIESLYIQNSGASEAFADRRGFAASALEIATESSATQIAINGRILTQGGAATGLETAPLVSINGAAAAAGGQFHPRSTINGCVIGADCNPEPEIPELGLPTSEDVESPVPQQGESSLFVAPLIELAGTEPLITPPLVDEPITGVGNDDLWEPRCEPDEEDGTCPEDDGQP